jgi:hypothetical protein
MGQDTSFEISSKLAEYFNEMLFDENTGIDRVQSRIKKCPIFHVRIESKMTKRSMSYRYKWG